jgi:small subunit ribosomal protein S17
MSEGGLRRKKMVGIVISDRMDKTALVEVERLAKDPVYKKFLRRRAKYMAHDPQNLCKVGDKVRIIESKPISRRKRWRVSEVIEKGHFED